MPHGNFMVNALKTRTHVLPLSPRTLLAILAFGAALTACNLDTDAPITVAVVTGGERCVIKEQLIACEEAAKHLREKLKIPLKRQINVSMDHIEKGDADVDRVAATIKSAGFTDVRAWHFGLQ